MKKKLRLFITAILLMVGISTLLAQTDNKIYDADDVLKGTVEDAYFKDPLGGAESYLEEHYRRPADAPEIVDVPIRCIVEKNGTLSNIEIGGKLLFSPNKKDNPILPSVRKEVMRMLKAMPQWVPAKKDGKPVRMNIYVQVRLMDKETSARLKREAEEERTREMLRNQLDTKVYDFVTSMPKFPGGDKYLVSWIKEHIKYPPKAKEKGVTARVVVRFVIEKDGSISGAQVTRNSAPEFASEFEAEALRFVNSMPRWTPGYEEGVPVRVRYDLPINFR